MAAASTVGSPEEVEFSVLVSCYFEERTIDEFHARLSKTLQSLGRPYEVIFVNDGSTDGTWERLERIFEQDPRVSAVVDLMKNSGQSNAKTPGVMLARGRALVLMDSDLQLDPEDLPRLVAAWDRGCDIVSGYREERRDPWRRKLPSLLANAIMRRASKSRIRDFGCTYKIYDGTLVRAFEFGPFKPWRPVPVISMAQRLVEVPVRHHPRKYGKSGWTFAKLFSYNMENLVNVSDRPFQMLGSVFLLLASLFLLRLAAETVFDLKVLPRVTPGLLLNAMVVSLLVTLGVLSMVGEFVIRNFVLLQQKPAFVVRRQRRRHEG
jgi:glycosyltransferase involved in cell wall biosynthesis